MDYLKISVGESATVKLLGPPVEQTGGRFGTQYNYPIEHGGKEMTWTATARASDELSKFKPGDRLRIENKRREGGGSVYIFHSETMDQGTVEGEDRLTGMARYLSDQFKIVNEKLDELIRMRK